LLSLLRILFHRNCRYSLAECGIVPLFLAIKRSRLSNGYKAYDNHNAIKI
jgi:hypothetical protein